ncbi:flagellar hook-basal body complex protein [Desulfovibrio intestinalis]|uniref:Flagellar hook protein FlgE n=1 Tax=Desulfovibrio intestinalis TaxID=58621 RepID=A0A7W8FH33_9BACT|nr:flagellar hook protein FlgE [Desulfovibrio intestinalis]
MNSSLYIGATGMKGLAEGMNVTTNNIANISTIGYKQQGILFSDIFYAEQGGMGNWWNAQQGSRVALGQVGMGLQVESVRTMFGQGSFDSSNTVTDMAISGKGFFQVTDGVDLYYTRAGDFRTDNEGVLRTPSGMALNGYKYNADGTKGSLQQVTIDKFSSMPAKTTTAVDMRFNLGLTTQNSVDATNPYFSLLGNYDATNSPAISNTAYGYAQGITLYGADGSQQQATIYFDSAASSQPGSVVQYLIATGDTAKDGSATAGTGALMTGTLTFDSKGQLTDMTAFTPSTAGSTDLANWVPSALSSDGLPQMTVNGVATTVNLGISSAGGWQNAPANAAAVGTSQSALGGMGTGATVSVDATTNYIGSSPVTRRNTQDGYPSGALSTINITSDGTVVGTFSNNQSMNLWQIPVCRFTSEDGLHREGNNLFSATPDAGKMEMGEAGTENYGTIRAYNTENSNVDMATEMTNMIITQRGFQSNSKVVTTADQMLQKAVELKR